MMQNKKVPRTKKELLSEIQTQIKFLANECRQYDSGDLDYHKKIAVTLRILLHETKYSKSLLQQIETLFVYNRPDFIDISTTHGDLPGEGNTNFARSSLCQYDLNHYVESPEILTPKPILILHGQRYPVRSFKTWWDGLHVVLIDKENFLTRKKIVSTFADTDGGAHVDPELNEDFALMKRNLANPVKIIIPIEGKQKVYIAQVDQILQATIRSIAEEVLYIFNTSVIPYCIQHT